MPCHGHPRASVCPWGKKVLYDGGRPNSNIQERLDHHPCALCSEGHHKDLGGEGGRKDSSLVLPHGRFSPKERRGLYFLFSKHFFFLNICSVIPNMLGLFSGFQTSFQTGPLFK